MIPPDVASLSVQFTLTRINKMRVWRGYCVAQLLISIAQMIFNCAGQMFYAQNVFYRQIEFDVVSFYFYFPSENLD